MPPPHPASEPPPDLTRFFELSPDPLVVLDEWAGVVMVNPALAELVGVPVASMVGSDPLSWVHPEEQDRYRAAFLAALTEGTALMFSGRVRDGEGRWAWLEWHLTGDPVTRVVYAAARDITHFVETHDELHHVATTDWLTGIANRSRLMAELHLALEEQRQVSVLYLDLNHFKRVNDEHGHLHGDDVLRAVAGRLQGCVRDNDLLGRLGGDEFVVLTAEVEGAPDLARRLVSCLDAPIAVGGQRHQIGVSIGISRSRDWPDADPLALLQVADRALYRAKAEGGGVSEAEPEG